MLSFKNKIKINNKPLINDVKFLIEKHKINNIISSDIDCTEDSIAQQVRKWGSSSSIVLLDPSCKIFTVPGIQGSIGYRTVYKCAVVLGDPVCPPENKYQLAIAFNKYCRDNRLHVVWTTMSKEFTDWAMQAICKAKIEFVEELFLDPAIDPTKGSVGHLLRKKMNHSKAEGVNVEEYIVNDEILQGEIEKVAETWLSGRTGPQIFLSHIDLFANRKGKRWFYAHVNDKIVGVLLLNELQAYKGYVLNMLMVTPDAPNGTSERLVITAIETLRKEGVSFLSFGGAIKDQLGIIQGIGSISEWMTRKVFNMANHFFHLSNRRKYWLKFQPKSDQMFILFSRSIIGIHELHGIAKAFNIVKN